MSNNPIVIYDNDPDGITSAWCFKEKWGEKGVTFVRASHKDPIPKGIDGRDVYMADVCFETPEEIIEVCERARSLTILDHHATTNKVVAKAVAQAAIENLTAIVDINKSACRVVWEFLNGPSVNDERNLGDLIEDKAPMVVKYVEDFDLYRFKLPLSREICACYSSYPIKLKDWEHVVNLSWDDAVDEGRAIMRYQNKTIAECLRNAYLVLFDNKVVPCINVSIRSLVSDIGHFLCKKFPDCPFSVTYYRRSDGLYKYSFRSEDGVSAKEVAEKFGGGGHGNAAGTTIDFQPVKLEEAEAVFEEVKNA